VKISFVTALFWIVASMFITTGGAHKGLQFYHQKQQTKQTTYVCRIVQTGPQFEALKTAYLAELLQISADRPLTASRFNAKTAQSRLLASPVIEEAKVKLHELETIYIDYTVRQPVAWLYDFENTAIDAAGYPFPIYPFFSPKKLPEIYVGMSQIVYGRPLKDKKIELALAFLEVAAPKLEVIRLDVSKAFEKSLGQKEVVMMVNEKGFTKTLRLTPKNFAEELGNYLELKEKLPPKPQVIDLRISKLAFVQG
jgi:hypothetical protein